MVISSKPVSPTNWKEAWTLCVHPFLVQAGKWLKHQLYHCQQHQHLTQQPRRYISITFHQSILSIIGFLTSKISQGHRLTRGAGRIRTVRSLYVFWIINLQLFVCVGTSSKLRHAKWFDFHFEAGQGAWATSICEQENLETNTRCSTPKEHCFGTFLD